MTEIRVEEGVVLLSPEAEPEVTRKGLAPRLPSLAGATVGVINALKDPQRSHAELFTRHVGEILLRNGAGGIVHIKKQDLASDMPEEVTGDIVSRVQAVVILEGD